MEDLKIFMNWTKLFWFNRDIQQMIFSQMKTLQTSFNAWLLFPSIEKLSFKTFSTISLSRKLVLNKEKLLYKSTWVSTVIQINLKSQISNLFRRKLLGFIQRKNNWTMKRNYLIKSHLFKRIYRKFLQHIDLTIV